MAIISDVRTPKEKKIALHETMNPTENQKQETDPIAPNYSWIQTHQVVTVNIPVPSGTKAESVACEIKKNHLKVGLKGQDPIIDGELYRSVKPGDCSWNIEDQKLISVLLTKQDQMELWKCCLKGEPEIDSKTRQSVEKMMEEEEEEEPLSPVARMFQWPGIDNCIIINIGFKEKINVDIILEDLKNNVYKHPRFSSILGVNGTKWIKTKVNVEDHVFAPSIDLDEIGEDGDGFVEDYVSRLTTIPLDRSRPLWDIHVLNVKTSNAEAVIVIRSHHCLGDGMSLMSLLMASTRKTSHPETFPTIPTLKGSETTTTSTGLKNKDWLMKFMFAMCSALRLIWNTFVDLLMSCATTSFLKDTETSLKGRTSTDGKKFPRRFYHRIVSLDDIKLIKKTMNMTINDVLLGVTQAALSRYLNCRYGKMNKAEGGTSKSDSNNLPNRIRFHSLVAVNLRSKMGLQPLADMMSKGSECRWGNYISSFIFPFYIGLETDPLVYLSKAKSTMDRKKNSFFATILYWYTKLITIILGDKVAEDLFKQACSAITTCVSNIVGPVEEVSFHGHPIAYIAISSYGHPQALLIHFVSYAKKMMITVGVDPVVIPDPQKLLDEMEDSLNAMKAAISEGGLV